ncbi:lactonase family protein [Microbacterium enclense]|uniref:6-phosphogluconolactonase, cycloisomerase 2 family n=1 Tax=Microbacterium enclense TaxID=993073 RepID=A0A1G6R5X5_9MICO|nr:beta-propeller fold lactonase family protein [Microbacterium enclense]KSU51752.1 3-carboxymuconate cyclase [Microbacterium enclense]SDD00042.1 6-phosphogluconolactonase, cycloisomerase 2 family [Microbacterium enclense]
MRFWVGAYAPDNGSAEGIGILQAGEAEAPTASGPLGMVGTAVAAPGSPSWIAAHPTLDVLYAALEFDGTVQAYRRVSETRLAPLGPPVEAGSAVCHVAVSPDASFLVASCWGDGRVVRIDLDAAGRPSRPVVAAEAVDPYGVAPAEGAVSTGARVSGAVVPDLAAAARALREAAGEEYAHLIPAYDDVPETDAESEEALAGDRVSRAHQAIFLPGGLVATTEMGLDLVRIWRATDTGLRAVQDVVLPEGSGPRHGLWHPSGHLYVVTELSREVFVLAPDREGRWHLRSGQPLLGSLDTDTAAEICASRDASTLYAGVRGSDTVGVLSVRGAGETLQLLALAETGTHWPRHHVVVDDMLLVAGQLAHEIVSLPLDVRTGVPGRVRHRTASPSPTRLLPMR